jgi:hypothetical protein
MVVRARVSEPTTVKALIPSARFEFRVGGLDFWEGEFSAEGLFEFPSADVVAPGAIVPKVVWMVFDPARLKESSAKRARREGGQFCG